MNPIIAEPPKPTPDPTPGVARRHVIRKLTRGGDTKLAEWNPDVKDEVDRAHKAFDDLMTQEGYGMFVALDPSVKTPEQIFGFTNDAPEILAVKPFRGG